MGELSFAYRIQSACKNLGWKADVDDIENPEILKNNSYDFVISLAPGFYTFPSCKNYLAIFHPIHHYFESGILKEEYSSYDGYLLTYTPEVDSKTYPYMPWFPTVQRREYQRLDPQYLFHIYCTWGNRFEDDKFRHLFSLLDKEPYARFYGNSLCELICPQSYQGGIPFDGESLCATASQAGVSLILHSSEHNKYGLPSGRIFEAIAASTVIICDQNRFVHHHFGDSILYINTDKDAESIFKQIQSYMAWIKNNPDAALEKAKKAHEIYKKQFLLEDQLLKLEEFHHRLSHP